MSKRKYKVFLDVITVLLILFPLIMAVITSRAAGSFEIFNVAAYVEQFVISSDLAGRVGEAMNVFGIAFDGGFYNAALVIFSNAILIYIFRVLLAVVVFIPKLALKFINISISAGDGEL